MSGRRRFGTGNRNGETVVTFTPPKINIEPENDDLEDDFPVFSGSMLVFRGVTVLEIPKVGFFGGFWRFLSRLRYQLT